MVLFNLYYFWSLILFSTSLVFLLSGLFFLISDYSILFEWVVFSMSSVSMSFVVYLDWISMVFSFTVFFISSMVVLYSKSYMGEYNYSSIRFLFLVLMFVLSMLLMILSPNLISIMLGWDGLGLVSYCLVIYYSSLKSYLAGMITCLINRLGDIGLLISIGWLFSYGSWNFIFYSDYCINIMYLIVISSFTKSAQIPFSSWLPAAMAAPTPVSSLVHSSTLVTAGVYLLLRFFTYCMFSSSILLFMSLLTMIMSSVCANFEFDLKKIIALSTLSQLGLMMSCILTGMLDLAFFHLLSHAMFKSCLFLCSGIIIHLMGGNQDIRLMGSICWVIPTTCTCFNISNMSLCGLPFLSGFYSKDFIVELGSFNGLNILYMILFYLGLGLTALYSIRLTYYTLLASYSYSPFIISVDSSTYHMKYSVVILSFFSVSFGCLYIWLTSLDMHFIMFPFMLKFSPLFLVLTGLFFGYELNRSSLYLSPYKFSLLNGSMWYMYSYSYGLFKLGYTYSSILLTSLYWGEFYGGLGLSYYLNKLANASQLLFLGGFKTFLLSMIIWFMIFL
uniref:NADH dehydrogenase subunit 5 n=1 Tax=Orosius sp. TaxID=2974349 RepID=UPI0021820C23|nr:NADH dehydrogenase subunit 5 [Orosius sp.]UVI59886.1 NADH dehydrogenase subunit 5 [Orosius sp.]